MSADECMGLTMSTYYSIAVIADIVFAVAMLVLFLKKTRKYAQKPT